MVRADSEKLTPLCARYAQLRVEGETLLIAETSPAKLETVARYLRVSGSPAIFVARPEFVTASELELEPPAGAWPVEDRAALTRETILARLEQYKQDLQAARQDLVDANRLGHALSPAAEWILDNSYLIHTQIMEVRRHLPRDYSSWAAARSGHGDVSSVARQLVSQADCILTEDSIREHLRAAQSPSPFTIAELWAFPLFLRMALIEALERLSAAVNRGQQLREVAYLWANRLAAAARAGTAVFDTMLHRLETEPIARQPHFVTALAERLQDEELALGPAQHWIEQRFGKSLVEVVRAQHTREAAETVSTSNSFNSLRALSRIDFRNIFEDVSLVEAELRKDPGGTYRRSDFRTRDRCRRTVERVARYSGLTELEVATRAVWLARDSREPASAQVGYYLLSDGLADLERDTQARIPPGARLLRFICRNGTWVYIGGIVGLTACFAALAWLLAAEEGVHPAAILITLTALAVFPLSELCIQIMNAFVISLLPPDPLPKLDFRHGIPPEHATLVVVPMMLSSHEVIRAELKKLEIRFLANRNANIFYSLFPDFTDSPEPSNTTDADLLQTARQGIAELNQRYPPSAEPDFPPGLDGDRFLLFHRPRVWSNSEQMWIGRERKRGKLEELNAFLVNPAAPQTTILDTGRLPLPIAYVITVDADTQLPPDTARRMIETIAHPLNKVEIDPETRVRRRGYTIIQPRVSIALPGATATRFTRIFADATGTDPYSQTVSDAQQDLFFEAIYHGKAIYDVRAFHTILADRFPPESLLSHDLIEGAYVGVGLASDIEVFEHLPTGYGAFASRQHRWTRGDWQIARWAFGHAPASSGKLEPNPLSAINRWRILDNLRRSLGPVAALLLLLLGWLTNAAPGVWSLVVAVAIAIPAVTPLLERLARRVQGSVHRWQGAADELIRALVMVAFLPHQAWISVDAIVRVFYRRHVSRRKLLEWHTAEHVRENARRHRDATFRQLTIIAGFSALLIPVLLVNGEFALTSSFLVFWIASPALMRWMNHPSRSRARRDLDAAETHFLRGVARTTWRFFDDLVGPESNWLPPDNSQLALRVEVASRTSPTNIGLWLTSALAARDFGYLTVDEFCLRCTRTLDTLSRMEHYEGHLLNWYDTRTLEALNPRYVSTVDSGNLIAALWVLEQGCNDLLHAPVLGHAGLRGLHDTLSVLREKCGDDPSAAVSTHALRRLLHAAKEGHELIGRYRMAITPAHKLHESQRWHTATMDERTYWASKLSAELSAWTTVADRYVQWMETLASPPDSLLESIGRDAVRLRRRALHQIPSLLALAEHSAPFVDSILVWRTRPDLRAEAHAWLDQVAAEYETACRNAAESVASLRNLMASAARIADSINMRFLYDASRRLFGVGYSVGGPREFTSHYDLLASECRLASLIAIAKGDIGAEHWHAMNRPWVYSHGGQTLLSWSGTMFEYLMPLLFTRTYSNSLLDYACQDAVERQIDYGNRNGVPWGISESAWSALDVHQIYQYRAFGVPLLALNPGTEEELVVSPYSSVLAMMIDPAAAVENLQRLQDLGMAGPMGFYEAIDFSRENRKGERGVVIYCYMAHHQGMSLNALDNVLHRDIMQRRFHSDLRVHAVESLLFEGVPITRHPIEETKPRVPTVHPVSAEEIADRIWTEETAAPRVHLHGNGHYALMITNSGGGYSRWGDFDISRWRSDSTLDPWGTFIFIRDLKSEDVWATTHKPFHTRVGELTVRFASDRAEIHRRVAGLETVLDVTVASEDDVELRRLRVTNRLLRSRQIELTSYLELAMTPHSADRAHPAFVKMFIETECPQPGVLIAHRRPRAPGDPPIWTAHVLVGALSQEDIQHETDRGRFLGRSNSPEDSSALRKPLTGSVGTVIDPVFSLRCRLNLDPRERKEIAFLTIAAPTRDALMAIVAKYQLAGAVSRAFEMAWTRAQLEFRFLRIGPGAAHRFQELASQMIYPNPRLRPPPERLTRNRLGQESLWAYGISGDLPMLVVLVPDPRSLALVREVLVAHAYWRIRGFKADVIILNQEAPSYDQPLKIAIQRHIQAHASEAGTDRPGGVFLRDWHAIPEEHRTLIIAAANILLSGNRGSLQQQLVPAPEGPGIPPFVPAGNAPEEPSRPLPFLELPYFNGLGGFTRDGREYAIYLKPGATTPAPWVNVMANEQFGALVGESGLGFTWAVNSQANRLTPWHNDPVVDPQSEILYLRDDDSGAMWTPTALPRREKDAYRARHGQGYTVFEHNSHALGTEMTVFVPIGKQGNGEHGNGSPVKVCRLRLRNDSSRRRHLTLTWYVEWTLGADREDQQIHIQTSRDAESGALLARQFWNGAASGRTAFAACSPPSSSWTCDRGQVLGRDGSRSSPAGLDRVRLDNRAGPGGDPCAAHQIRAVLERGQTSEFILLLGQTEEIEGVRALLKHFETSEAVEQALEATQAWWNALLGSLQVRTPVLSVDLLLNRWLLYQTLSCRFWGRSALYQSGGAFGFRDQLQDSMAFVYSAPELTRKHILAAAARQFIEGDVQHWWHPDTGVGVRTLCSDDLLWLPFTVAQYVKVTGDVEIMDEIVPFLEAPVLGPHEHERMMTPAISTETAPLWEHCRRAIEHGPGDGGQKIGPHGVPLIGNGDWNDGMNLVGPEGRGESVWLGWFLCSVLESFADLIETRPSERHLAAGWRQRISELQKALEQSAWDGEWYLRAWFDDGSPLGSHRNLEARIDSLPQSWSVISGAGDPARARRAMHSAETHLVRERDRLVQLFTPPFDHSEPNPGYIMGYPPGLRENGGQYTHGSLWMAMACARLGEGGKAVHLLQMMNPIELNRGPDDLERYRGEPYVVAADVGCAEGHVGQCGWTWYTGSAAWMYRVWIEEVLGFQLRGDHFTLKPSIPADWPGFELTYRRGMTAWVVTVARQSGNAGFTLELDGEPVSTGFIPLVETGRTHQVTVRVPATAEPERHSLQSELQPAIM